MKDNYQVIKLTSGENIICDLKESDNNYLLQVKSPLKMEIVNRVTKSGMVEALALTRWVQPFTEQESIMINKSTVVTMVPASSGMSKSTNIVKLSNGENLICTVVCDTDKHIEIESPLKMETISRVTKTGVVESLSLGKWMQPFTDQKTISLNKNLVIINLPVTIGLEKYYEYVLKKMDLGDGPSEEELKAIEEEERQDVMSEYIKDGFTIH